MILTGEMLKLLTAEEEAKTNDLANLNTKLKLDKKSRFKS